MKKHLILLVVSVVFGIQVLAQIKAVKIGNQIWMAENLSTNVPGSWCYNESEDYGRKYGRLYTWEAAIKACPKGWHIPTDDEWTELANYLGGEDIALKELKNSGSSGFNIFFGGFADGHAFSFIDNHGGYWSSTSYDDKHAWYRYISVRNNALTKTYFFKNYGVSVRCIKDKDAPVDYVITRMR